MICLFIVFIILIFAILCKMLFDLGRLRELTEQIEELDNIIFLIEEDILRLESEIDEIKGGEDDE